MPYAPVYAAAKVRQVLRGPMLCLLYCVLPAAGQYLNHGHAIGLSCTGPSTSSNSIFSCMLKALLCILCYCGVELASAGAKAKVSGAGRRSELHSVVQPASGQEGHPPVQRVPSACRHSTGAALFCHQHRLEMIICSVIQWQWCIHPCCPGHAAEACQGAQASLMKLKDDTKGFEHHAVKLLTVDQVCAD